MITNEHLIALLDDLLFLGERERYFWHLRRLIDDFKKALPELPEPDNFPVDYGLAVGNIPSPDPFLYKVAALLQPIYEETILSGGDGDGAPARALLDFKRGLIKFHLAEVERLKREIERFQP